MSLSALARLSDAADALSSPAPPSLDDALLVVASALDGIVPADGGGWVAIDLAAHGAGVRSFHDEAAEESAIADGLLDTADDHPMVRAVLGPDGDDPAVPTRLSDVVDRAALHRTRAYAELLAPLGIEHQVFVPTYRVAGRAARGWAFNRSTADFTDHDLDTLRSLQLLLTVIERLSTPHAPASSNIPDAWGLTRREAQVLGHLADGWTADAIGALCGISGRTVRKHLEHAYEKLGCHDKVTAVLRFRSATYEP